MNEQDVIKFYNSGGFPKRSTSVYAPLEFGIISASKNLASIKTLFSVCHHDIQKRISIDTIGVLILTLHKYQNSKGAELFFDWLLNKSPVRDGFLTKDPKLALTQGVIQSVNVSPEVFLAAGQLARLPGSEFDYVFDAVVRLLEYGTKLNPLILIYLAWSQQWSYRKDTNSLSRSGYKNNSSNHLPFPAINKEILGCLANEDLIPSDENNTIIFSKWDSGANQIFVKNRAPAFNTNYEQLVEALEINKPFFFNNPGDGSKGVNLWPKATEKFLGKDKSLFVFFPAIEEVILNWLI
jgi:hypothetical protein